MSVDDHSSVNAAKPQPLPSSPAGDPDPVPLTEIPVTIDLADVRSDIGIEILETKPPAIGISRRPLFHGKLFSVKNNKPRTRPSQAGTVGGGHMYNYEEKYEADDWGWEMRQESRFYRTFVDECDIYDIEKMEGWRDVLDVLLVFIGLFSAIVTTFVVQTSQALQPDYGQVTATLIYTLILQQQFIANGSATTSTFPMIQHPEDALATPSRIDKWVNGLWFASLALSLSTALVAVLTKQWLYHYISQTSGSSQERARLRQFRFMGLEKYKIPMIIDALPVALHLSLALFLVGLSIFLWPLHTGIAATFSIVSGVAYIAYIGSAILPSYDPQCPYNSPISTYLHGIRAIITPAARAVWAWMMVCYIVCVRRSLKLQRRLQKMLAFSDQLVSPKSNEYDTALREQLSHYKWHFGETPLASLQTLERQAVTENSHQLDIDAITWLHSTSSNLTVRNIAVQAVVGLTPSDADTTRLIATIQPYYDNASWLYTMALEENGSRSVKGDGEIFPGQELQYARLTRAACIQGFQFFNSHVSEFPNLHPTEENGQRVFHHVILPALHNSTERLNMGSFLASGPRAHIQLPLSVWCLCLTYITEDNNELDSVMMSHLLALDIYWSHPDSIASVEGVMTFETALRHNRYLYSLLLGIVKTQLNIMNEKDDSHDSLYSLPILMAVQHKAMSYLDTNDGSLTDTKMISSLLTASFESCKRNYDHSEFDLDTQIQIQNTCTRFLVHDVSFTEECWESYCAAGATIYYMTNPALHCSSELFHSLISHLDRNPPAHATLSIEMTLLIPSIVQTAEDPEMLYIILRERDAFPPIITESDEGWNCHRRLWEYDMCRVAVFAGRNQIEVDITLEWAVEWIQYIDTPQRLLFLFKVLLVGLHPQAGTDWLDDDGIADGLLPRVSPLLELTRHSQNWVLCFGSLLGLLEDEQYIASILRSEAPRHQMLKIFCHMQRFLTVDVSMYDVPVPFYDGPNDQIPPEGFPLALAQDTPEHVINHDRKENITTSSAVTTRMLNKVKAVVRFTRPTPKQLEESFELP